MGGMTCPKPRPSSNFQADAPLQAIPTSCPHLFRDTSKGVSSSSGTCTEPGLIPWGH